MKNSNRLRAAYFTLLFFVTGCFTAFADGFYEDDLDPFLPDNPDPGNASLPNVIVLFVAGALYVAYYLAKTRLKTEQQV